MKALLLMPLGAFATSMEVSMQDIRDETIDEHRLEGME